MYDLTGQKRGELTVLYKLPERNEQGKTQWYCVCSCGKNKVAYTYELTNMRSPLRSCRKCQWHLTHKEAYNSWTSANQRCYYPRNKDYPSYGGRGIKMCPTWKSFPQFLRDMGDPPIDYITSERLSLDRIDNNGDYSKENCRWATRSQQQLNKSR